MERRLLGRDEQKGTLELIIYRDGVYRSGPHRPSWIAKFLPTPTFYRQFALNVWKSSRQARRGDYDAKRWSQTSHEVMTALESVGVEFEICGIENVRELKSSCVFVGNHMSMLETMVLPAIIQPIRDVTFVVKQSLLEYPVFQHIVGSRDPIAVSRNNPREDFKTVMTGGLERLGKGVSIVVFPQTTRASKFEPAQFNTIGMKLASRASVPIVPIALKTDAWGNGKRLKDLGPIDPDKKVHFAFGPPIDVVGRGSDQHQQVIEFIESNLNDWGIG